MRYKILKDAGQKTFYLKLKDGVLPHIFDCQPDRRTSHSKPERSVILKRQAAEVIQNAFLTTQSQGPSSKVDSSTQSDVVTPEIPFVEPVNVTQEMDSSLDVSEPSLVLEESGITLDASCSSCDVGVPANVKPRYRSRFTQTERKVMVSTLTSPIKVTSERARDYETEESALEDSFIDDDPTDVSFSVAEYSAEEPSDSDYIPGKDDLDDKLLFNAVFLSYNVSVMENNPKLYLGVDKVKLPAVLHRIESFSGIKKVHILIILRKLRLNESIDILADIFGCCKSTISRILSKKTPYLAALLDACIFWPDKQIIQSNVPTAFKANYSHVQSILDCFEVEIERPSDSVHQSRTWSDYKKCNTLKYLVSCAPDGLINFISKGYGGRASDVKIVKECGFLDTLKPNTCIMADRGFKKIETLLHAKQCSLLRPPSVPAGHEMSKDDVRATKIIASLRINVERVIGRIREYKFLGPHARFHHDLVSLADHNVVIACALCNMQGPVYL